MYGSKKPGHEPYKLKYIYENKFDPADNEPMTTMVPLKSFNIEHKIEYLSARGTRFPSYPMNQTMAKLLTPASAHTVNKKRSVVAPITSMLNVGVLEAIMQVRNHEELALVVEQTLSQLSTRDYELLETHKYTMTLPEKYYGAGSYEKWLRVGMALSDTCPLMFVTWVAFSAQSPTFNFADIPDLYNRWQKFDSKKGTVALTRRSIMHWSKQDAYAKFKAVRLESVDYYIDKTVNVTLDEFADTKRTSGKPCGDFDIANVLKQLYKDEYVCVSIKNNIWFKFHNHRWIEIDSGTTLRKAISTELRDIYHSKMAAIEASFSTMNEQDQNNDLGKMLKKSW